MDPEVVQNNPVYAKSFADAIMPIMKGHESACLAASNTQCENCGSPRTKILQTPCSWLHNVDGPFVSVWVHSICDKTECNIQTRQDIEDIMAELREESCRQRPMGPKTALEILPCQICGKTEATKRCARCKLVAYCGKEHQKVDWKVHRKICVPKDASSS